MTTTPARRTSPSDARPAPGRVIVALAAVLAVMAVGIITLFAGPASASPLAGAQNAVGVIAHGAGQRVGPHESIPAGQGRARAPNYDQTVVGSGVGAEAGAAASGAPTEITGYTQHGLEQIAERDGGLGVSQSAVEDAVANPTSVVPQQNGTFQFVGKNATVVLNQAGKVVTAWATNSGGTANP